MSRHPSATRAEGGRARLGSFGALLRCRLRPFEEAIELFTERRAAELVVENWNRGEPERAGELRVEPIELETSPS
jgi:hypothetical protein